MAIGALLDHPWWTHALEQLERAQQGQSERMRERERKEGARASKTSERGAVACMCASTRPRGVFHLRVVGHEHEALQTLSILP